MSKYITDKCEDRPPALLYQSKEYSLILRDDLADNIMPFVVCNPMIVGLSLLNKLCVMTLDKLFANACFVLKIQI